MEPLETDRDYELERAEEIESLMDRLETAVFWKDYYLEKIERLPDESWVGFYRKRYYRECYNVLHLKNRITNLGGWPLNHSNMKNRKLLNLVTSHKRVTLRAVYDFFKGHSTEEINAWVKELKEEGLITEDKSFSSSGDTVNLPSLRRTEKNNPAPPALFNLA